jgi:hypothetical protein
MRSCGPGQWEGEAVERVSWRNLMVELVDFAIWKEAYDKNVVVAAKPTKTPASSRLCRE